MTGNYKNPTGICCRSWLICMSIIHLGLGKVAKSANGIKILSMMKTNGNVNRCKELRNEKSENSALKCLQHLNSVFTIDKNLLSKKNKLFGLFSKVTILLDDHTLAELF